MSAPKPVWGLNGTNLFPGVRRRRNELIKKNNKRQLKIVDIQRIIFVLLLPILPVKPAQSDEHYVFDKSRTVILFSVSKFGIWEITGTFRKYEGDFVLFREDPRRDRVSVTLYAAEIQTGDGDQNRELQGPHFFNAAQFPKIRFTSTEIKPAGENNAEILGNLDLLGVRRPVTLYVHYLDHSGDDDSIVSFTADAVIKRTEFGMDYLSPLIGNEVRLHIEARGVRDSKSQGAGHGQ